MCPDEPTLKMTVDDNTSRIRTLELEGVRNGADLHNLKDDVRDIKKEIRELAQSVDANFKEQGKIVDQRLGTVAKLLWGAVGLLFTGFLTALGILVSQGGIGH